MMVLTRVLPSNAPFIIFIVVCAPQLEQCTPSLSIQRVGE